jgi:hypothetical protein
VTFGLGLHIPGDEIDLCRELTLPAWIAIGLQNDLWSWPKERDTAEKQGKDHVMNALWVLMQEYNCEIEESMGICRKLIKEYVATYLQNVERYKNDTAISADLRKYLSAMLYSISGNVVWSLTSPRYNSDVSLNQRQLEWMDNGVPDKRVLAEIGAATIQGSSDSCKTSSHDGSGSGSEGVSRLSSSSNSITTDQENDRHQGQIKGALRQRFEVNIGLEMIIYKLSLTHDPEKHTRGAIRICFLTSVQRFSGPLDKCFKHLA